MCSPLKQGGGIFLTIPSVTVYIMEIQKIFSNTENEGEKLYSVLMSKDEINLYSQFQKEHSKVNWDEYNLSVFEKKEIEKRGKGVH